MNPGQLHKSRAGAVESRRLKNGAPAASRGLPLPEIPCINGMPIMYEDDEEGDLGESNPHVVTDMTLHVCLGAFLEDRPKYRVFSNMNLYYVAEEERPRRLKRDPYVSPDSMVVEPFRPLGKNVSSFKIGRDGPAPVLVAEILSERSAQQRDLAEKLVIYSRLGIAEYILIDTLRRHLPEGLLLKRLQPDGTWQDCRDADGGITSHLGFRLIIDSDGEIRLIDAKTGRRYARPDEAEREIQQLKAQLEELAKKQQKHRKPKR